MVGTGDEGSTEGVDGAAIALATSACAGKETSPDDDVGVDVAGPVSTYLAGTCSAVAGVKSNLGDDVGVGAAGSVSTCIAGTCTSAEGDKAGPMTPPQLA